jgi:6-phospho-3-hexuloisomerase
MQLFHVGIYAHIVGEMTTTPASVGDLLLVYVVPGDFASITALLTTARKAGARTG